MKRYGRLDENLQGTLQKNRVFCAVMPIHDQRISRRTETRRLFELTKLKKAPSFVIVGLFSADHYLVPCLSLLSSECVVLSITQVSKDSDDSERQIQRYIRLTCLIPELLSMVDDKKIAFNPAVEISYLDRDEQLTLLDAINMNDCTPSHAQSIRLKKMSQDGLLTADAIYAILSEEKPNQKEQIKLPRDELRKYFPQNYSDKQIKRDILKGLELLKRQRERNRDAR